MSAVGDVLTTLKSVVLLDFRVSELTRRIEALEARESDTRDRIMRLETYIQIASGGSPSTRRLR